MVIEASTASEWVGPLSRGPRPRGHRRGPELRAHVRRRAPARVKTDRRDARALAEAGLLGADRPAHRLSDPQRHVRGRLGVRDALVHPRPRSIAVIRALLRQQGSRVPSGSAEGFIPRVRAVPGPAAGLADRAPARRHAPPQPAARLLRRDARAPRGPGSPRAAPALGPRSGPVTAAAFLAAIDAAQRFPHAHQLEASLGLVPRADRSGETPRRGPITTAGHSRGRGLLIQAALSILRRRPPAAEAPGPGPCAAPRAGARTSPAWRSPAAGPAFSMRSSGTERCIAPPPRGPSQPRRHASRVSATRDRD